MKRAFLFSAATILIAASAMAQSQAPSLGDYARAVKKTKPAAAKTPATTYDNDNLPRDGSLSVVGTAQQPAADPNATPAADSDKDKAAGKTDAQKKPENSGQIKPGQTPDERKKANEVWKQKIDAQKDKVDLLARELDVLQRENRIRTAAFYSDAGNRLRNTAVWDSEEAKYQQQITDKQKSLEDARTKLTEVQEEARKAGAPNSAAE